MTLARQIRKIWKRFDKGWVPGAILSVFVFIVICFDYARDGRLSADMFLRSAVISVLLFFLLTGVIGSLVHDILLELRQYGSREDHEPDDWVAICVFVAIKALVRCTVGVVVVLAWLGGVVMLMELSASLGFAVPAFLSTLYSIAMFWVAYRFVVLMDRVRFPNDFRD